MAEKLSKTRICPPVLVIYTDSDNLARLFYVLIYLKQTKPYTKFQTCLGLVSPLTESSWKIDYSQQVYVKELRTHEFDKFLVL